MSLRSAVSQALSFQYLHKTVSSCEKSSLHLLIPTGLKVPCRHLNLFSLLPWHYLSSSAFQGRYVPGTVTFSFSVRPPGTRMIRDNMTVTQYMVQCSNRNTSLCSHWTNLMNILPGDFCKCSQWATHSLTGSAPGQGKVDDSGLAEDVQICWTKMIICPLFVQRGLLQVLL